MKRIFSVLVLVFSFLFIGCNYQLSKRGNVATGESGGQTTTELDTLDRINSSDPDGITGNSSTYGTGTGVSGQTPAGIGKGTGNTGRSGVGIKKDVE